jgi:FtsP/CotA-like multicopper oxidase with cupredoxin domain
MKMTNAIILGVATTALLLFAALPIQAATFNLTARAGTVTMPDGASVPVWGLVLGADTPLTPVPVLIDTAGATLTINLTNELPEPVSLVINGQTAQGGMAPVFFVDDNGRQRVRSFTNETAPNSGPVTYTWSNLKPGTYLLTSGSHPSVQVPMGLYAVLQVNVAAGEAYPGQTYTNEATLLFSEIDPALNQAVVTGIYGDPDGPYPTALKVGYKPKYFLLNGRPWSASALPLATITAGDTVLLRMLNAGLRARTPIFPGQALTMIAEDGNPANYQPTQYSADLVAGKTLDALLTISAEQSAGYLPIHDRMLGLSGGGMFGYLAVNNGTEMFSLNVNVTGPGSVSVSSLPGGIVCPGDCSEDYPAGTAVTLHAVPAGPDSALTGWSVVPTGTTLECTTLGDCVVTLDQAKTVTATFVTNTAPTLVSPNGGEQVPLDATLPIRWTAPEGVFTFDIGYSAGPGSPFRLIANRVAGREFLWNLAAANVRPSNEVRLAIISYDATGTVVGRDTSDAPFSVVSPISLMAPNGGENLAAGSSSPITWSLRPTTPAAVRASLWYQSAPTSDWRLIADVNPASAAYAWTVPTALTTTARVAMTIYDADGKAIATDASDATFSIVPPVLPAGEMTAEVPSPSVVRSDNSYTAAEAATDTDSSSVPAVNESELALLFPNSGEVLPGETPVTVLWQTPADAVIFSLDYSLDGGQNWQSLAKDLDDTQFNWQIDPRLRDSKSVLLRVTAFGAKGEVLARDLSDETFTID